MLFSGFFGAIVSLSCVGAAFAGAFVLLKNHIKLNRTISYYKQQVATFIQENALQDAELGFYNRKEKALAEELNISDHDAYGLLSIELNRMRGTVSGKEEKEALRKVLNL